MGPELSKDARKTAVIVRALYGLKSTKAAFISNFAICMESMGYASCKADLDLWLKPETRQEDGVQYYHFLLCYVNGILYIHHNADAVHQQLH